eukprot:1142328-Pelagomonas_calceolata.AAC.2
MEKRNTVLLHANANTVALRPEIVFAVRRHIHPEKKPSRDDALERAYMCITMFDGSRLHFDVV